MLRGLHCRHPEIRMPAFFLWGCQWDMTITEASERYNIPLSILREYESWGLCDTVKTVMGAWQYDEEDIERLSMIMTLHDIGFGHDEIASYMRLRLQGDSTLAERTRILKQQRDKTLDEIHFQERRLDRLDYLRHQIRIQSDSEKSS